MIPQRAPGFRISKSARDDWAILGIPDMTLEDVVGAVFSGGAEIITVYKIVEGKPFWTLVAGLPAYQVELKGRCDAAGRWKVILEASVTGV